MYWILTTGGPLILISASIAPGWRGVTVEDASKNHYEIACQVEGYSGIVFFNGKNVLVLNDEPLQTAIYEDVEGLMIIRWMYAPDEASILGSLGSIRGRLGEPEEVVEYSASEEAQVIMDASEDARYVRNTLQTRIEIGRYRVSTYVDKPMPDLGLIIHVFTKL